MTSIGRHASKYVASSKSRAPHEVGFADPFDETAVLLFGERDVEIVRIPLAVPARPVHHAGIDAVGVDRRSDGVVEVEVARPSRCRSSAAESADAVSGPVATIAGRGRSRSSCLLRSIAMSGCPSIAARDRGREHLAVDGERMAGGNRRRPRRAKEP